MKKVLLWALVAVVTQSGCAQFTHYNKSRSSFGDKQNISFIDAKQRVIVSSLDEEGQVSVCSEPSPDALSAIAASQGISLTSSDIEAGLTNAVSESAGSIGLRTQSIQLMRDAMYRLCEARVSGSLEPLAFETLHRRFQSSMVAILAIEQLTRTVRAPTIALGGSSSASAIALVANNEEIVNEQETLLAAAKKKHEDAEKAHTAALKEQTDGMAAINATKTFEKPELTPEEVEQKNALAKKVSDAETEMTLAKEALDRQTDIVEFAKRELQKSLSSKASTTSTAKIENGNQNDNSAGQEAIAQSVADIVKSTLSLSFSDELCTTILTSIGDDVLGGAKTETITNLSKEIADLRSRRIDQANIIAQRDIEVQSAENKVLSLEHQIKIKEDDLFILQNRTTTPVLGEEKELKEEVERLEGLLIKAKEEVSSRKILSHVAESNYSRTKYEIEEATSSLIQSKNNKVGDYCLNELDAQTQRRIQVTKAYSNLAETRRQAFEKASMDQAILSDNVKTQNFLNIIAAANEGMKLISEDFSVPDSELMLVGGIDEADPEKDPKPCEDKDGDGSPDAECNT